MKKKALFISLLILFSLSCQSRYERVKAVDINGLIQEKYIDKNHAVKTMVVNNKHYAIFYWLEESSALWNYIEEGDSVYKPIGSTTLRVVKKGAEYRDFRYMLD